MNIVIAAAALMFSATAALSCSAIADDLERLACYDDRYSSVSLIRCTDRGVHASCDLMSPSPDDLISCVIFNADGDVIARETATGAGGMPIRDMSAAEIASVDCQIIN